MIIYRIFKEIREIDGAEHEVYGVAAFDETGEILSVAPNITSDIDRAKRLVDMCCRHMASPCHLFDIAEDFIISDDY